MDLAANEKAVHADFFNGNQHNLLQQYAVADASNLYENTVLEMFLLWMVYLLYI